MRPCAVRKHIVTPTIESCTHSGSPVSAAVASRMMALAALMGPSCSGSPPDCPGLGHSIPWSSPRTNAPCSTVCRLTSPGRTCCQPNGSTACLSNGGQSRCIPDCSLSHRDVHRSLRFHSSSLTDSCFRLRDPFPSQSSGEWLEPGHGTLFSCSIAAKWPSPTFCSCTSSGPCPAGQREPGISPVSSGRSFRCRGSAIGAACSKRLL